MMLLAKWLPQLPLASDREGIVELDGFSASPGRIEERREVAIAAMRRA